METQREIDFGRAEQLGLLRRAEVPALQGADGKRVSPATLKGILRVIDDHGGGREAWLSFATIAREANCGVRTAKRAVECLEAASLLCIETRMSRAGVVCNHYRVVWSELALLSRECVDRSPRPVVSRVAEPVIVGAADFTNQQPARSATGTERSATRTDQSATRTDQSATWDRPECHGGTQSALKRTEAPPPPTPSASAGDLDQRKAAAAGSLISRIRAIRGILDAEAAKGIEPEAVAAEFERLWAIANRPRNRTRFEFGVAAAVVWRYRNGAWPVDDIVDDMTPAPLDAEVARRRAQEAIDKRLISEDFRARDIVKAGRRVGATDEAISAALARAGLAEASERLAWRKDVSPETRGDA